MESDLNQCSADSRDGNTLIVNQLASVKATNGLLTVPRVSRV